MRQTFDTNIWILELSEASYYISRVNVENVNVTSKLKTTQVTIPRPSEISRKKWSTKAKPFLTSHLWYKAMLKVWTKSWELFRIYQLTSTGNPAIICEIGLGSQDLFILSAWVCTINGMSKMASPLCSNFFSLFSEDLGGVKEY